MHKRHFIWLILLLAVGLLLPTTPALADGDPPDDDGVVIWNENYTLGENERLDGDLVVFNGDATLEVGSRVAGSVVIWNGNAKVEGTVEEDLVVSGGDIYLNKSAWVEGDVVCTWNCDVEQEEGARVDGRIVEGIPLRGLHLDRWGSFPWAPIPVPSPPTSWVSGPERVLSWMLRGMRDIVGILVVAAMAGLVALIWPHQTTQVGRAVVETPWPSFGVGLLTIVAATALIIALAITICLSPIAVLAALALGAAGLFGWIGIGTLIGERLLQVLKAHENENQNESTPMWAAGLGTLLITLISVGLSAAFCLAPFGWLLIFTLGCLGLGAVVLTRFGTTAYAPSRPTPPPPVLATDEEPEPSEPQEGAENNKPPEGEGAEEAESSET